MALFPDWLPWLDKRAAVREAGRMIVASGAATNALIGFAAAGAHDAQVVPSRRDRAHWRAIEQRLATTAADGPPDSLDRALELLSRSGRTVPPGNVRVRPLGLPAAAERGPIDRRARGRLGHRPRRRPGPRLGALVPRRLRASRCRSPIPTTARRRSSASAARRRSRAASATSSAPPRLDDALLRPRARSRDDHEQRPRRRARGVPRLGRRAARPDARLSVSETRLRGHGRPRWRARRPSGCSRSGSCSARRSSRCSSPASSAGRARPCRRARGPGRRQAVALDVRRAVRRSGRGRDRRLFERRGASRLARFGSRRTSGRSVSRRPGSTGRSQGDVSLLRTRISLECLTRGCLPPKGGARVVRFPPLAVTYRAGRARRTRARALGAAAALVATAPRHDGGVGIVDTAPPLEPRFERSPELLRTLFLVAAAVLGLAGAALVVTALWPPSFLARRRWRRLSPLERSLLRVEAAATSDDEAVRRRTLDDLATRLGDIPSPSLEPRTRALAWGQSPPEPEALTLLAEQVRTTLNGGVASLMVDLGASRVGRARRSGRPAIPSVDAHALAPAARRTRVALTVLALLALAVAVALVPASNRPPGVPAALRGGDGLMVVIDVSSSTLGFSSMIAKSLLTLANDPSQRAGLVLASQSAYMALPPETPGSALRGWQRMIDYINEQNHKLAARAKLDRTPLPNPAPGDYPWVGVFTGGTRLSTGLARAIQALREAGTRRRADRPRQRPSRCTGGPSACRCADHAHARARDRAPRRHRGSCHAQSQGVLGHRRLCVHHGRGRLGLRPRS